MAPGTELTACERRIVESQERSDTIRNYNLTARYAIQFYLDEPVRSRDAAFEMLQIAESRRDLRPRVAGRSRPHTENPGRQIVGRSRRPCVTSAPSASPRVPVFLERGIAPFDLRPPLHASCGNQIAPARANDRVVQD